MRIPLFFSLVNIVKYKMNISHSEFAAHEPLKLRSRNKDILLNCKTTRKVVRYCGKKNCSAI